MKLKVVLAMIAMLLLDACSVNGNVVDLTQKTVTTTAGKLQDITSGGHGYMTTSGGYHITGSLGSTMADVVATTSGGYTVYSNVQGAVSSTTTVTTYH
jgi:hypothetical protein